MVGASVGASLGESDGEAVGEIVGGVGDIVGASVGDKVGAVVGLLVGEVVGEVLGDTVGLVVGDVVGDLVGPTLNLKSAKSNVTLVELVTVQRAGSEMKRRRLSSVPANGPANMAARVPSARATAVLPSESVFKRAVSCAVSWLLGCWKAPLYENP